MSQYAEIVNDLVNRKTEEEWFEFKKNWFDAHGLGEYISALSNAAALCKVYFVILQVTNVGLVYVPGNENVALM